ncbi:putative transposase IS605 family [Gloeothece citriformis PCC 7424]|uniref:Putative transposase IS605 family n=1 Tax=Gloeothece citriformis (strain PCC 7424) TaxID=65393 RepID=B7KB03_GLOC7|nr:RNA-guided endonuclease TnpB family protein [Gloeothece citriformis]ACK70113.1 putative transposase IS605 family [Gloeothece citriformis PCC 7424]
MSSMRIAHQYRLLPTTNQKATINRWLDMLRHQYNHLLSDRFNWWECNRSPVNSCPLVCHLPELREQPDYYSQKRSLVELKDSRPWYKDIHSQVLQNCVERVKLAMNRFIKRDSKGQKSGKPRFKAKNRYRTFTYPQGDNKWIVGNKINLPKIGLIKVIWHRPIPDGFTVKTVSITKKADGFYVTLSLEDKTISDFIPVEILPTMGNSIGIDMGLEKFATTSDGVLIEPSKFLRKNEEKLNSLQSKASSRPKKSRARKLLYKKVAKLHQKIARQRKQFHFEESQKLLSRADVIFVEDLSVKNMSRRCKPKIDEKGNYLPNGQSAKSGLNKSFADAGLSQFVEILSFKAEKAGLKVIKVDPKGTSQHCSNCLEKVPKELSDRWHCCPFCSTILDRDLNSAILIKKVGLGIASLKNAQPTPKGRKRSPRRTASAVGDGSMSLKMIMSKAHPN